VLALKGLAPSFNSVVYTVTNIEAITLIIT